jgi:hypothetical protein
LKNVATNVKLVATRKGGTMAKNKKEIVWFGMKVTPDEKEKIRQLANYYDISQKDAVMSLVNDRVADLVPYTTDKPKPEILQHAGVFEGDEHLSTDKSKLSDYGRSSLS